MQINSDSIITTAPNVWKTHVGPGRSSYGDKVFFSFFKYNLSVALHTSLVGLLLLVAAFLICKARDNQLTLFLRKHSLSWNSNRSM